MERLSYELTCSTVFNAKKAERWYGIRVTDRAREESFSFPELSTCPHEMQLFMELVARNKVTIRHIDEVIADYFWTVTGTLPLS